MYDDDIFELSISNDFNNYFINVPRKIINNIVIPPEFNNMGKLYWQIAITKKYIQFWWCKWNWNS